jgi:hypothetical protein
VELVSSPPFDQLWIREGFAHLNLTNPNLTMPILEWLVINKLKVLIPYFNLFGPLYGYDSLISVPTMYYVKYMSPLNLKTGLGLAPEYTISNGSQVIWEQLAMSLRGDVNLGRSVTVERCSDCNQEYHIISESGRATYSCDNIIIAFPPTSSALYNVFPSSFEAVEDSVFSRIMTNNYASALVQWNITNPILHSNDTFSPVYIALDCTKSGQCEMSSPGYNRPLEGVDVAFTFSDGVAWTMDAQLNASVTDPLVEYETAVLDMGVWGRTSVIADTFTNWVYFPHFQGTDLVQYAVLEVELQGMRNTFYTGGFLNFETIENAVAYSKQLVYENFPPM